MMVLLLAVLGSPTAHADDLSVALQPTKKTHWDPKGKALDPFGRGDAKRRGDDLDAALPLLLSSLKAQPGCGKCLDSLARLLVKAERYDDAVRIGHHLDSLYPDRTEGLLRVAQARETQEDWTATAEAMTAALENEPDSVSLWRRRNTALRLLGDYDQAGTLLEGANDIGVEEGAVACMQIQLHAARGEPEAARALWEPCDEAKSLDLKRTSEGWLALAEGDAELGAKRLAMSGADKNLTRVALAWMRLEQGRAEAALNLAAKVIEEDGAWAWDAHLALAQAHDAMGQPEDALATLTAGPMAPGWEEKHPVAGPRNVMMVPRGPTWPGEVARRAAVLHVSLTARTADADTAQQAYDAVLAVHGASDELTAALQPEPPAAE